MARKEKSCGGVIVEGGQVLMVLQENDGFCGFPKGHMEPGETEIETAKREILEETGVETELDVSKRVEVFYHIDADNIDKTVILFAGKPINGTDITPQAGEIKEVKWIEASGVDDVLTRDSWKKAWHKMKEMIEE